MRHQILYDYYIFSHQKYGGVSRYIFEIASRIALMGEHELDIFAGLYINEYLQNAPAGLVKGFHLKDKSIRGLSLLIDSLNYLVSEISLRSRVPSIIHETFHSPRPILLREKRVKRVVTVYDMIQEKFYPPTRKNLSFLETKAASIKRADHIICISENTRQDLIEILNVNPDKISTVHLGCSFEFEKTENNPGILISQQYPYILYVGSRKSPHKNFSRLLEAYARSDVIRDTHGLVCFGKPFSPSELLQIDKMNLKDRVSVVSGNDEMLMTLYRNASVFVYPSIYEGFGLPLLEAMNCGCPVVCSDASSIPEVAGDAAEYFNPHDIDDIGDAIQKVVSSEHRSKDLRQKGFARSNLFSWQTCAVKTKDVYNSLLL